MIRIKVDMSPWLDEIDRLLDTHRVREDLGDALDRAFEASRALAHKHTGAMRGSARKETAWNPFDKEWTGTIEYPDEAAIHEIVTNDGVSEEEGTPHSAFWDVLTMFGTNFREAIERHLRGDVE